MVDTRGCSFAAL